MSFRIILRRDDAVAWAAVNPILADGEPAYEKDTGRVKIGDGVTAWNDLGYFPAIDNIGGVSGVTIADIYADRPDPGDAGRLFFPTDGHAIDRDDGQSPSAWHPWGPVFPLVRPPEVSNWTWINQGSAAAVDSKGGIFLSLSGGAASANDIHILKKAAPSPPYTLTAVLLPHIYFEGDAAWVGVCWRESSSGKLVYVGYGGVSGVDTGLYSIVKFTNPTSFSANYKQGRMVATGPILIQLIDNNTNRIVKASSDGQNWTTMHSVSRTDFMTADEIGIFCNFQHVNTAGGASLISWALT